MIFRLVGIGLIGVLVVLVLRTAKPEFAVFVTIATGIIMLVTLMTSLSKVLLAFDGIVEKSGVDEGVFSAVLKIIGIGYLAEYSSSVATDAGCASIAEKLQLGGKVVIFLTSISIVTSLVDVVTKLANL